MSDDINGRVRAALAKHAPKLKAERVWHQFYGATNGFGIAADWGGGKKMPIMVSRSRPESLSDEQLSDLISVAVDELIVRRNSR